MKPYYQDDFVTIYHGDCREILSEIEADVLVTDPPYGIAWKKGRNNAAGSRPHPGIAGDATVEARNEVLAM